MGVLGEWRAEAGLKDEDIGSTIQLFAYQPDDIASRWQRSIFGLGEPPNNVFHEDANSYGTAVVEAYAQYRFASNMK